MNDTDDDHYSCDDIDISDDDSESDLEPFIPEDDDLCVYAGVDLNRYGLRERSVCVT